MKLYRLLFILLIAISCQKDKPLLTGKVYIKDSQQNLSAVKNALVQVYPKFETYFSSENNDLILFQSESNAKGAYRIEGLEIGNYYVVLQAKIENAILRDTQEIHIKRNTRYTCNFILKN